MLDKPWQPPSPPKYLAKYSRSLGDLFVRRVQESSRRTALQVRRDGRWQPINWHRFHEHAAAIACYLMDHGVMPGDKVCIVGNTRPEWCYADFGGQLAGAITLGAYPTLTAKQLAYIVDHSDSKVAFVEGVAQLEKLLSMRDALPKLERVCVWNHEEVDRAVLEDDWLVPMDVLLEHRISRLRIAERIADIAPESTAIIVYTSGTTGPPKGAMLSHKNILVLLESLEEIAPFDRDDSVLSFLPMAHVAERVVGFYARVNSGMASCMATSTASVLDELSEVRPTIFGSVPRVFEKAYGRVMGQVDKAPPVRQKVFRWAENVGREVVRRWQAQEPIPRGLRLQYNLADYLVFARIREVFGGRMRYCATGAAPIAPEILEFFWAAGFPIFEGYGMTEATAVTHFSRPGGVRISAVGRALSWVDMRIADDGELLVRGGCVFQGYYKDPEATAAVMDAEGWLHTGDIVREDDDGYLYIVDRKKHIIITAGGKNLTPANIESEVKVADSLISQVHVHGDRRPYLTALVTIGAAEAVEYANACHLVEHSVAERVLAELAQDPLARPDGMAEIMAKVIDDSALQARIVEAVRRANRNLAQVETIKRIYLLDRELSIDEDELTPTLKVKRKAVEAKFASLFDRLYNDPSFGIPI